jgi:hypothetical protein
MPDERLALQFVDAGPSGWDAGNSLTAREIGLLDAARLWSIPGRKGEHLLFLESPMGRYETGSNARVRSQSPASVFQQG